MSISPFHGGLVFREDIVDSSYPTHIEHVKSVLHEATKSAEGGPGKSGDDLNARNLNEFFNP